MASDPEERSPGNAALGPFLILLTLLENYYLPNELERAVESFVEHYNRRRYHESIGNLTPADVNFGRSEAILSERRKGNPPIFRGAPQ